MCVTAARLSPSSMTVSPTTCSSWTEQVISSGDCRTARVPLFGNDDVLYSVCRPTAATPGFYRNGGADELIFVARGAGILESAFGRLPYRERDLVVIPRGVTHRWVPDGQPQDMVVLETTSPVGPPARYRSSTGQLLDSAPCDERDIRAPKLEYTADEAGEYTIVVKAGGHVGEFVFDRHPFNVVGWDGYLYPYALNLDDFEPISGRVHPLPDQYQVFAARGVAVCAMVPHPNASDPRANPAQAHHMNVDYDELMYRFVKQENDPLSRTITLHPRSLAHRPKPGFDAMPISPFLGHVVVHGRYRTAAPGDGCGHAGSRPRVPARSGCNRCRGRAWPALSGHAKTGGGPGACPCGVLRRPRPARAASRAGR